MQDSWLICNTSQQKNMFCLDKVFAWLFGGWKYTRGDGVLYRSAHASTWVSTYMLRGPKDNIWNIWDIWAH